MIRSCSSTFRSLFVRGKPVKCIRGSRNFSSLKRIPRVSSAAVHTSCQLRSVQLQAQSTMSVCKVASKEKFERLPDFAQPIHYDISLSPDLKKFVFDGTVNIDVNVVKATKILKLHAQELDIKSAKVEVANKSVYDNLSFSYDAKLQILTINLPNEITPQKIRLNIVFTGELNDKMRGFYRSSYKNDKGEEKYLASTQFESTSARLSFPCWDEPMFKATFDVKLITDKQFTALSNMDVFSAKPTKCGNKTIHTFNRTPIMSTYLVAFAVGDLEYVESKTKSGTIMRVYTRPGVKEQGAFALELATRAIDWYNEWFDIPYPLPKCDLIAIPDFSMGAMENWGLVTYREVALLVDPAKTSTRQKSRIALIIAHELAHLWFGDLVTMKWWTDLWLKEGFASFMEYMFVGYNYKEFKIWLSFLNDELASGFELDAMRSSHPIEVEIDNPNELDEIYDSITYAKSNSVNRMLCYYLGEPTFQKGLRLYLKKYQYGNAETIDLWNSLSEASGQNVAALMSGWTKQMGFPLVSVTQRQDGPNRILTLKQKRFLADGGEDTTDSLWQVPITVSVGSNPTAIKTSFLLKKKEEEFVIKDVAEGEWLKLNVETTGFYRVEYDNASLKALLAAIASRQMPSLDRFGITNDMFALVKCGRASAAQFLELLEASTNEDEYIVWQALDAGIADLVSVLSQADSDGVLKNRLNAYLTKTLEKVGERVGWEAQPGEDSQKSMMRAVIQGRLSKAGHAPTIAKMNSLFEEHYTTKKELHPDIRLAIYTSVGRNGAKDGFDKLIKIFETAGFAEVERQALLGASQTSEKSILKGLFKYGIEEGKVRPQDLMLLLLGPGATKAGHEFLWPYFKQNIKVFVDKFGGVNTSPFQHCFKMSAEYHCSEEVASDVETFFCTCLDDASVKTLDRPIRQVTESIRLNKLLLEKNKAPIEEMLTAKGF